MLTAHKTSRFPLVASRSPHFYVSGDVRDNGRRIRGLMDDAAASGARLIQFPECAASGYEKSQLRNWDNLDWSHLREELAITSSHAKKLGVHVVLGSAHFLSPPHRPHNSLYIISNQGQLAARYDKRFCSHSEITDLFSPGFDPLTFELDGFRFGCALCIKVQFPELFAEYGNLGVDCMLLSSYSEDPMFEISARAHANANNYWLGFSTQANSESETESCIIGPNGSVLDRATPGQDSLALATLDRDDETWIVPLRYAKPWRQTARRGEIYRRARITDPRSSMKTEF